MKLRKLPKGQQILSPKTVTPSGITVTYEQINTPVLCPFCLHIGQLYQYEITLKSGKISQKYECPECHQHMRKESLTSHMTTEEYAQWVWDYRSYGFFQIINFEKWNGRLRDIGISYDFWRYYKILKAKYGKTDYDSVEQSWNDYEKTGPE